MPRFIIPPKYVYGSSEGSLALPFPNKSDNATNWWKNGMIPHASNFQDGVSLFMPTSPLPVKGSDSTHDRVHSKITVTTIRWKFTLELTWSMLYNGTVIPYAWRANATSAYYYRFPSATDYTGSTSANETRPIQWPPNPQMYFKFRYMMVEFDEDIAIDYQQIFLWFYSTFCLYKQFNSTAVPSGEVYPLPGEVPTISNTHPGPISVHSNVMRMTTPWTGKFKILADKCFTISASRPRVSLDITVPINRVFTFADDWQYSSLSENTLLSPHIYCFVLPPLSYEMDLGEFDSAVLKNLISNNAIPANQEQIVPYCSYTSWMKLNFVDI